ncbi:MAG TPA: tRNA (adenosine(37)-N6)-threonylcarbamoyltransferase complex transferase subunit TsaD [Candidatus Omnitrophota bacterium]|nr:tRNA (adenosine(37)-N6)-threonylcarbamoyltransferase complex transferase subunit TsaD [Candidatus Omnitrophota bacterium]
MITLGIETSCDETSCAVLEGRNKVLSNIVSSSLKKHRPFGGVVPEIASRHCLEAIDIVYREALDRAGISPDQIRLIAVTQGPGLAGSLLVGVSFAKALGYSLKIPLVAVNHLEAHLDANFIESGKPRRPFVGLLVSGGHTTLIRHEKGRFQLLGKTLDDAVGEAYDKVAKVLGLAYPGGPEIDRLAKRGDPEAVSFTAPKLKGKYCFSFSGIKTAVLYRVRGRKLSRRELEDLCAGFQESVVSWIVRKAVAACEETRTRILVAGGGVIANSLLRERLLAETRKHKIKLFLPPLAYTTDNAAMVARNGIDRFSKNGPSGFGFSADPNLKIGN